MSQTDGYVEHFRSGQPNPNGPDPYTTGAFVPPTPKWATVDIRPFSVNLNDDALLLLEGALDGGAVTVTGGNRINFVEAGTYVVTLTVSTDGTQYGLWTLWPVPLGANQLNVRTDLEAHPVTSSATMHFTATAGAVYRVTLTDCSGAALTVTDTSYVTITQVL